jgi:hypothetical protein
MRSGLVNVAVRWRDDASPMNLRQARADGAAAVLAVGVPGDSDGVARIFRMPRRLGTIDTAPGSIFNQIRERDGDERHYRIIKDDDKRHSTWEAVRISK